MVNEQIVELKRQLYLQKRAAYRCAKVLERGEAIDSVKELFEDFRDLLIGLKEGSSTALKDVVRRSQIDGLLQTIDLLLAGSVPDPESRRELHDKLEQFRADRRDRLNRH
ncbi:MAG: hypothetical protein KW788_00980 [Candidatus Doudnabacteria bacterium]|nr:hypothetical protein [Candidatus Doudnabacteria bacterium]